MEYRSARWRPRKVGLQVTFARITAGTRVGKSRLGAVEGRLMRHPLQWLFVLLFVVLPFAGTSYAAYQNDHLPLLAAVSVLVLLVSGAMAWAERSREKREM